MILIYVKEGVLIEPLVSPFQTDQVQDVAQKFHKKVSYKRFRTCIYSRTHAAFTVAYSEDQGTSYINVDTEFLRTCTVKKKCVLRSCPYSSSEPCNHGA